MRFLHSLNSAGSATPNRKFLNQPFLVVDWLSVGVVLSQVSVSGRNPVVLKSQFVEWPVGLDPLKNAEQAGAWLRTVCDKAGMPVNAVAISVPRRDLSVRLLELPSVSDDELGPLVALQVESKFQSTSHPMCWDFVAHPAVSNNARHVVLASLPSTVVTAIQLMAKAAGWSNLMVTSGDVSIGLAAPVANNGWQLHIQASSVKLEVTLCHDGSIVASSAAAMPTGDSTSIAAGVQSIISRMLSAIPASWQPPADLLTIAICGTRANSLADALSESGIHATVWCDDDRSPRALAVAHSLLKPQGGIDFLQPRSGDRRISKRRRRRIIAGIAAAAILITAVSGMYLVQQSLHEELAQLKNERQQLQQYLDRGQAAVDKWTYLTRWQKRTVNSATEIRDLAKLLPGRERLIVTRLQLENLVDADDSVLRIDGLAADSTDVLAMNSAIIKHGDRYELRPQGIEPSPEGSELSSQFRIEVLLKNETPAQETVQ